MYPATTGADPLDMPLWELKDLPLKLKRLFTSDLRTIDCRVDKETDAERLAGVVSTQTDGSRTNISAISRDPYISVRIVDQRVPYSTTWTLTPTAMVIASLDTSEDQTVLRYRLAHRGTVIGVSTLILVADLFALFVAWRSNVTIAQVAEHPLAIGLLFFVLFEIYWYVIDLPMALRDKNHPGIKALQAACRSQ
jgi:hypothetical protein